MEEDYALRIPSEMYIPLLRDMTPCRFVYRFETFGGAYCLHLQGSLLCSFETLVLAYQSKRRHIPEKENHQHRCDDLNSLKEMPRVYYYLT